jgi:hypothetical protein
MHAIGEMGLGPLFAVNMQWKSASLSRSTSDIMNEECFRQLKRNNWFAKRPTLLGFARLEIQLIPKPPKESTAGWDYRGISDCMLSEAAYLPRQFTIVVEKGNFEGAQYVAGRQELRLTFDTSPYPTADGYNQERTRGPPWKDI